MFFDCFFCNGNDKNEAQIVRNPTEFYKKDFNKFYLEKDRIKPKESQDEKINMI